MTDEEVELLKKISSIPFIDIDGQSKQLLSERELNKLLVRKGNLTSDERDIIQQHPSLTHTILKSISWGKNLKNVPLIAACHHEKLNATGYPWNLKDEDIPFPSKILAIVDIFDALTAEDRPYKPPLSHDVTFRILHEEAANNHIDKDLLTIFKEEKVYILNQ